MLLLAALVLGGGTTTGLLSDFILQFIAILVLAVAVWKWLDAPGAQRPAVLLVACAAIVALPLLQLVPLPPSIWSALPQRSSEVAMLELARAPLLWAPLSVAPTETWSSVFSLLVPVAIFLAVVQLGHESRRMLTVLVLAVAGISVALGLSQLAFGREGVIRFYAHTDTATGFFANRNHFAALLYCAFPVAAVWAIEATHAMTRSADDPSTRGRQVAAILIIIMLLIALIAGQAMSRSRAGVSLGVVAMLAAFVLAVCDQRRRLLAWSPAKMIAGVCALGLLLAAQFAMLGLVQRFASDPLHDPRLAIGRSSVDAATGFMPVGAGAGTFVRVFPQFEKPDDVRAGVFVNRAHNDWLELAIETGVLVVPVIGVFLFWYVRSAFAAWRTPPGGTRPIDVALQRAAAVVVCLLLVHSAVDYPLRTGALAAVFALACAMLVSPLRRVAAAHSGVEEFLFAKAMAAVPTPSAPRRAETNWRPDGDWPAAWR